MTDTTDTNTVQSTALTIAQSAIVKAMSSAGISKSELARRMSVRHQVVSRMLSGKCNMTVRTLARALWACGYGLEIVIERIGNTDV